MCKFCELNNGDASENLDGRDADACLVKVENKIVLSVWQIEIFCDEKNVSERQIDINFCPICGRKLNKEE
jgi:hypothetical protein